MVQKSLHQVIMSTRFYSHLPGHCFPLPWWWMMSLEGFLKHQTVWMNGQLFSMARSFAVSVLFSSFPCVACLRGGRDRWDHQICFQEFSSTNDNAVEKAWWLTILGIPQFLCLIQEKSYSLGDPRIFPSICRESTGWGFTNLRELVVTFHKEPVASRIALFGRGHLGGM